MTVRIYSTAERRAAVRDLIESGDTIAVVAERHGVARSTLGHWSSSVREDLGYHGASEFDPSAWEQRGGILCPLYPARRSA